MTPTRRASICDLPAPTGSARVAGAARWACESRDHDTGELGAWDIEDGWCETCHGTGTVDCLCGGDLCVCLNDGTKPCPDC